MVEPELLYDWVSKFFGYGSWSAPYWFIGLEEGGVDTETDFDRRVNVWDESGQPNLIDLQDFHRKIGHPEYCRIDAPLQSTWRRLMPRLFSAKGIHATKRGLKHYQAFELGSSGGETALLELSPLPARAVNDRWFQRNDASSLDFIDLDELKETRRGQIANRIDENQPRAVICYGEPRRWASYLVSTWTARRFGWVDAARH
jgi:hypothetical protein